MDEAADGGKGADDFLSVEGEECADGWEGADGSKGVGGLELAGAGEVVGGGAGGGSADTFKRAAATADVDGAACVGPVGAVAAAAGYVSVATGAGAATDVADEPGSFSEASVEDTARMAVAACLEAAAASVQAAAVADTKADAVGVVAGDSLGASPPGPLPESTAYPRVLASNLRSSRFDEPAGQQVVLAAGRCRARDRARGESGEGMDQQMDGAVVAGRVLVVDGARWGPAARNNRARPLRRSRSVWGG